jgi:hypothetical protein
MTIEEGNKLIAEFLGAKFHKATEGHEESDEYFFPKGMIDKYDHQRAVERMQFHSSWDWLMSVVEKIEGLNYQSSITYKDHVYECEFYITGHKLYGGFSPNSKILSVWNAVIEYVKSNNPQNPQ